MTEAKRNTPVRVGLLIVAISYFLFTLHATFTLQWVGEWNRLSGFAYFYVLTTDVAAGVGLVFRFVASLIAVAASIFYFSKGLPSTVKTYRILRWILILEAIYWLGLLTTAVLNVYSTGLAAFSHGFTKDVLNSLALNTIPSVVESVAIPAALFFTALQLNPAKPVNKAIKWSLITGAIYIFVFWLTNTSIWLGTLQVKGTDYLTAYPGNLLSFILTAFGLLALAIYATIFAAQSRRVQSLEELKLRTAGAIILSLGMYFLWNYLTWIFFNYPWSDWYAWFLGHNLDLWLLSLPLLGLPFIFTKRRSKELAEDLTP
jgi:hypothetical protein